MVTRRWALQLPRGPVLYSRCEIESALGERAFFGWRHVV